MCKQQKPEESFGLYKGKLRINCKECREYIIDYAKRNREHILEMRRLRYHSDPDKKQAIANAEYMKKSRANPERRKQMMGGHIKRKYGLSLEQYDKMLEQQQNKCAICEIQFPESFQEWNRPCVDHNHQTNKVRGILCRKCNISLHYIENFKFWKSARKYLQFNDVEDKELLR